MCRHSCANATHAIKGSRVCTAQCDTGQCCGSGGDYGAGKGLVDDTCGTLQTCPAGTYSGAADVSCIACSSASHAVTGAATCTAQCDVAQCCSDVGAGKGVFDDTCDVACPAGTYSGASDVSCILCQAGTYSSAVEASQPSTCQA